MSDRVAANLSPNRQLKSIMSKNFREPSSSSATQVAVKDNRKYFVTRDNPQADGVTSIADKLLPATTMYVIRNFQTSQQQSNTQIRSGE